MNSKPSPLDAITRVLIDHLSISADEITPEASLRDDLGMDSLDALEFASALEHEWGIAVDDDELRELLTVQDAMALFGSKTADRPAS